MTPKPTPAFLQETLDNIHSTASRSGSLTTFDDFTTPPSSSSGGEQKGIDLVPGGLSSLYSRIRASVGGVRDGSETPDDVSVASSKRRAIAKTVHTPKSPAGTAVSSPVVVSVPSSRLQSPLVPTFPDPQPPSSRESNVSSPAISAILSRNGSRISLAATKSRTSLVTNHEPLQSTKEEEHNLQSPTSAIAKSIIDPNSSELLKIIPSGAVSSSSDPRDVFRDASKLEEPFRHPRAEVDVEEDESDTTEDEQDVVVVDETTAPDGVANFTFSTESAADKSIHLELQRTSSRKEEGLKPLKSANKDFLPPLDTKVRKVEGPVGELKNDSVSGQVPQRPPLLQIGPSHLPGWRPSRASSSDGLSSITTATTARSPAVQPVPEFIRTNSQAKANAANLNIPNATSLQMRRKILDREYWMRDENAKDCFYCGDAFSTFRRKHHCRTCGQIFDSKCTSLVSGKLFGQSGTLRVCKPCEAIIHSNDDDDSSVYTEDADQASLYDTDDQLGVWEDPSRADIDPSESDHTKIGTPTISIAMSRKAGSEKKRRSTVIEVPPVLARPSSSRSLRSLSGRPRSSSHKRHHSRHQHMRHVRHDDRAPFHQYEAEDPRHKSNLSAFHHDNIIDPDLAPFMSDEESSEDEPASIFATLNADSPTSVTGESERSGLGGLFAAMRKGRSRTGTKSVNEFARDTDNASITSRNPHRHSRHRNPSVSSFGHARPSPRRTKSNSLLKPFGAGFGGILGQPSTPVPQTFTIPPSGSRMTRSASMHGGNAPVVELNQASLQHVRKLLKQMLQDASIPNVSSWEKALMPILLQCTDDVNPDVQHNDDIDIRHYIKLKKIPGGKPGDTSYVSGVVFTKQLALKSMARSITNPRIIIVTFPIEYSRHQQHFMSLEPIIAQEREYLRNLVSRIAALHPHLLLVERNVAGLALEFLEQAGITVAYNVKPTVLNAVARCTQTRMISSVDKLAIDPAHLGKCEGFDVKTYVHSNRKKTYIYLSGCQRELGCTIVLRGAATETLRRLKRVTEFMCYVVYNLKLETCLMRDEFVLIPASPSGGGMSANKQHGKRTEGSNVADHVAAKPAQNLAKAENYTRENMNEGQKPPGPSHSPDQPTTEKSKSEDVEEVQVPDDIPAPTYYSETVEKHDTKILSGSPFVKFMQPYLLMQAREQERRLAYLKKLRDQYSTDEEKADDGLQQKFELVQPEMVHNVPQKASKPVRDFLHAVHAAQYDRALHNYQTQKRQWEAYLSGNMHDVYDPFGHQKIAVLYSVVNSVTSTPCVGPEIISLAYYHEHDYDDGFTPDCTLGQYVEDLCHSAGTVCEVDGCNRRMFEHHRQYVHGEGQMSVIVQRYPSKIKGLQNTVLMWSVCRICGKETQVIPMSDNTWKYSFAKYLELTFWSAQLHPRADLCPHDIHKDHIRYIGVNNVALRIQYDAVQLYEVIVPRPTVAWKVDSDLQLKNEQFLRIEGRLDRFMNSVRARLRSIHVESVIPEKVEACRAEVEKLMKRLEEENEWCREKLQDKYMSSRYYEVIPMNRAIRAIQEKAIAWDDTFAEFEQQFFPSEKDIRRLAALQLKKLFLERDESTSSLASVDESGENSPVETRSTTADQNNGLALTPMPSQMSAEQARNMLTSVVEEDSTVGTQPNEPQAKEPQEPQRPSVSPLQNTDLPIQTSIGAVEREDVRHLDLAVSSNFPDSKSPEQDHATPTASPPPVSPGPITPTPLSPSNIPKPLDQAVADAVDNMSPPRTAQTPATLESKIPRLVDTIRREGAMRPTSLNRTQSQPGGVSRRGEPATPTTTSTVNKPESPKLTLTEAAKALERRMGTFRQAKSSSMIPRSIPRKRNETKVSSLAKHFEQLQREFEKERQRERRQRTERSRQVRAYPLASSKPVVEVYKDLHEAVQESNPSDEDLQPASPPRTSVDNSTLGDSTFTETTAQTESQSPAEVRQGKPNVNENENEDHIGSPAHTTSDLENENSDIDATALDELGIPESIEGSQLLSPTDSQLETSLELPKHEKTTLMKMLTSFWSERSASGWAPLDYPFAQFEHVWEDSDIIVREDEPSSIIALALSSPDYLSKLQSFRSGQVHDEKGLGDSDISIERNLLHQSNTNIRYGFNNRGVKAHCKIFYAQSFDALRRKCGVADRFVESLSRCSKWDSKGGKSKSIFLKTLDDRFVLKSLSPIEVNAFFKFAPHYFSFTHQNLFKGLPSVIAKMFGLFQVQIKTPTGRDFDWYMLVMENLFYDREPNRRYDLKGSMRNRKIQSTGERDEVLLDENLVDIIYSETPIFVREHTKKLLKASVYNDTLFLSQRYVMDYSLMAGFDDTRKEIIVGIIDCIRTYTWDKKLESWIKDRGKNKPTITSPKDYRNRFRIAMEKYILQAPTCWHQFQARPIQTTRHVRLERKLEAREVEMDMDEEARAAASKM